MTKQTKLKPCPFCGGEAELFEGYSLSHVYCINCDAQTDGLKNAKRAVELWNHRPIEDAFERENSFLHEYPAKLEKELKHFKKYSAALEKEVKTLREALKIYEDAMTYALANSIDADAFEGSFSSAFEKVENLKGGEE